MIESNVSKNGSIATSSHSSSNKEDVTKYTSDTPDDVHKGVASTPSTPSTSIQNNISPAIQNEKENPPGQTTPPKRTPTKKKKKRKKKKKPSKRTNEIQTNLQHPKKTGNASISHDASMDIQKDRDSNQDTSTNKSQRIDTSSNSFLLASNEYQTILKRRIDYITITPPSTSSTPSSTSSTSTKSIPEKRSIFSSLPKPISSTITPPSSYKGLDITQDMSLGMKLTIVAGHVIVQSLGTLLDGRASPAQLSGIIQKGDILIKINHINLRKLNGIELMQTLQVLSSSAAHLKGEEEAPLENNSTLERSSSSQSAHGSNIITQQRHPNQWSHLTQSLTLTFVIQAGLHLLHDPSLPSAPNFFQRNKSLSEITQKGMNVIYQKYQTIKEEAKSVSKDDVLDTLSLMLPKDFQLVDQFTGLPYKIAEDDDDDDDDDDDLVKRDSNPASTYSQNTTARKGDDDTATVISVLPSSSKPTGAAIDSTTANHSLLELSSTPAQTTTSTIISSLSSPPSMLSLQIPSQQTLTTISEQIATQINNDRRLSAFFQLDPKRSILYQSPVVDDINIQIQNHFKEIRNKEQLMNYGEMIMTNMRQKLDLFQQAEDALLYSDHHHYSNSRISMNRSNHTRRDLLSITLHEEKENNDSDNDDVSDAFNPYNYNSDDDDITVESLLITDAWKQRLMYQLQQATTHFSNQQHKQTSSSSSSIYRNKNHINHSNVDDKSIALESFLFGGLEQTRALTSETIALPPMQVTSSLFDLVSSLERSSGGMTVVTNSSRIGRGAGGGSQSRRSMASESDHPNNSGASRVGEVEGGRRPFLISMMSKDRVKADKIYFLLQEALPLWLSTFIPLGVDKRRMLWPRHQNVNNNNFNESTFVDHGDDVSVISMGGVSAFTSNGGTNAGKPKQLREILEETKLNPASRMHTCRLVTVYFTQQVLIQQQNNRNDILSFVQKYGAYLNLYPSLVSASYFVMNEVIDQLLEVASHDLHHNDAMSTLSKKGVLVLYEPVLLSALLESLKLSVLDDDSLPLLISAYPDLKPWQVKRYVTSSGSEESSLLYYKYMTLLLDPSEGIHKARQDQKLVCEWCDWSSSKSFTSDNRTVLYLVASSSNKGLYKRDVPALLDLSMKIKDYDLAMDLVNEVLIHPTYPSNKEIISSCLVHLRSLGRSIIQETITDRMKGQLLRVMRILNIISTSKSRGTLSWIDVSNEIHSLMQFCKPSLMKGDIDLEFIMTENKFMNYWAINGNPMNVLQAIGKWIASGNSRLSSFQITTLQILLKRAAKANYNIKLTGALIRVQRARDEKNKAFSDNKEGNAKVHRSTDELNFVTNTNFNAESNVGSEVDVNISEVRTRNLISISIWEKLLNGECFIDK